MANRKYVECKTLLKKAKYICNTCGASNIVAEKLKKATLDSIAADVTEVVRCKNCEEFYKGKCKKMLGLPNPYPDSFCSFGKRRKEE